MAYVLPNPIANGDDVTSTAIQQNYYEARHAMDNSALGDIANNAIDTKHLVKPDIIYGNDTDWVTGQFYGIQTPHDIRDVEFVSSHIKQANFLTKGMGYDLAPIGKQFSMTYAAQVLVLITGFVRGNVNTVLADTGESNTSYLYIDGSQVAHTRCYTGDYNGSSAAGVPARVGNTGTRWSPWSMCHMTTLASGTHTIQVKFDPRLEYCTARGLTLIVEVMY